MNKQELTSLMRSVAARYGETVKCEWLAPDGCEWIKTSMEINAHFLKELERGQIRNVEKAERERIANLEAILNNPDIDMKFILTQEEYEALMPKSVHEQIRTNLSIENAKLENVINTLKAEVVRDRLCRDKGDQVYCDGCRLGFEGINLCTSNKKSYSK